MHLSALDYLRLPFWALQLASGAKSFMDNPILGDRALNERGLHAARYQLAARMAAFRRSSLAVYLRPEERVFFDANGYFVRQNALPPAVFAAVRDEVGRMRGTAREMRQGQTMTRRIGLDEAVLRRYPACREVVESNALRHLLHYAASYGGEPTFQIQSVEADPARGEPDPQVSLHADTFQPTAKAWLYMDDVGPEDGPFAYVAGSHRPTPERIAWEREQSLTAAQSPDRLHARGSFRVTEEDLPKLGFPPPHRMAMPANTLVVADTSGFHARSRSAKKNFRVEIYATLRRNPYLPWTGGHLLAIPPFRGRHNRLDIGWHALLSRLGIAHGGWPVFEDVGPYDLPHV